MIIDSFDGTSEEMKHQLRNCYIALELALRI